jgi:hypothetical protein
MENSQQQPTPPKQESTKDKIKNFAIGFGVLCLIGWGIQYCGGSKENTSSSPTNGSKDYSGSHTCPHCQGKGKRYNNVTYQYGTCASCGGDGLVSDSEYERLAK